MNEKMDEMDRKILSRLQKDASQSVDEVSTAVGLSRNACWRRIRIMEEAGIITRRVALLDAAKVGCPLHVIVQVRTGSHDAAWMDRFQKVVRAMPEVMAAYRMTGDLDYLIRARVRDVAAYDQLYRRLIERVEMSDVSASFVMEELKETTELPL